MKKYDCIIVCGYPANGEGKPSEILKTRVDKAMELWKCGQAKYLIFSGAAVANEFTEAAVMKAYAVGNGIPEEYILEETKAVSTYHNMLYAAEIMKERQFKNCIVVTNGWHGRKARHYAEKFHLDYVLEKAKNPKEEKWWTTLWRYISINVHMFYMRLKGYH